MNPPLHHPLLSGVLLALATLVTVVFCFGMLIMRDAYQRLNFGSPIAALTGILIAVVVWIEENDPQARIKVTIIALMLIGVNAVLSHATAQAIRVKQKRRWNVEIGEGIHLLPGAEQNIAQAAQTRPDNDQAKASS